MNVPPYASYMCVKLHQNRSLSIGARGMIMFIFLKKATVALTLPTYEVTEDIVTINTCVKLYQISL